VDAIIESRGWMNEDLFFQSFAGFYLYFNAKTNI
jgi:hypothetical protein